jgi:hypothetical protein
MTLNLKQIVVDALNDILEVDPDVVNSLMQVRVMFLSEKMAQDPHVQVMGLHGGPYCEIGAIGFIGGVIGRLVNNYPGAFEDDGHFIGMQYDEKGKVESFKLIPPRKEGEVTVVDPEDDDPKDEATV